MPPWVPATGNQFISKYYNISPVEVVGDIGGFCMAITYQNPNNCFSKP